MDIGNVTGDELLQRLHEISGVTEERRRAQARMEREMRYGKLPIPFAWRPKLAFPGIRDQLQLWEMSKRVTLLTLDSERATPSVMNAFSSLADSMRPSFFRNACLALSTS